MSALIVAAWWTFYRWYKESSWKWALWSGLAAGAAMLVKSTAVFFLLGGMAVLVLIEQDFRQTITDIQVWAIALLAGVPVLTYHIYGVFIEGTLGQQFQGRFFPELLSTVDYYRKLLDTMGTVAGHKVLLLIGILGLSYYRSKIKLGFLVGIWIGYVMLCITFTYHSITHSYYHLPAIPLLAISISGAVEWFFVRTKKIHTARFVPFALVLLIVLGLGGGYYLLGMGDYRHEPDFYRNVAGFIPEGSRSVVLSQDYGNRIAYYGWITPRPWKSPPSSTVDDPYPQDLDQFAEYFQEYVSGYDYFIVTQLQEFQKREYLSSLLRSEYPVFRQGGGYLIFDLTVSDDL
jgi:hypothetical protein